MTGLLFVVFAVACLLSKSSCLPFMRTVPSGWPGNHSRALVLFPRVLCIYNLWVPRCVVGYNLSTCCIGLECNFFLTCTRNVKIGIPLVYVLSCLKVLQNPCPVLNPLAFALCVTLLGQDSTCWESRLFTFCIVPMLFMGSVPLLRTSDFFIDHSSTPLHRAFDKLVAHLGSLLSLPTLGSGQQC